MARIRSVHPGLFTDEAFVGLSCDAQVLLIGIWTEADDQGVFEWKPVTLRMRLRPTKDGAVEPLLEELVQGDCIRQFDVGGRKYGAVRNFRKYQRPKKPNSIHPMTPEIRTYIALNDANSEPDEDADGGGGEFGALNKMAIPPKSEIGAQMEDGGGRREDEGGGDSTALLRAMFDQFWDLFPRKVNKTNAETAFSKAVFHAEPKEIIAGARRYAATVRREKTEQRFICSPHTWLDAKRWTDGGSGLSGPSAFDSPEEQAAQRAMMEAARGQA